MRIPLAGSVVMPVWAVVLLIVLGSVLIRPGEASPAKVEPQHFVPRISSSHNDLPRLQTGGPRLAPALVDTFVLAFFEFGSGVAPDAQGWYSADRTAQVDTFWHVADSTQLAGNSFFGDRYPIEGAHSIYVGTTGNTFETCGYAETPSYGHNWSQIFESRPFAHSGDVTWSYKVTWDTEPGYDFGYAQYLNKDGDWIILPEGAYATYNGFVGEAEESWLLPDSVLGDTLRLRFLMTSDGAFDGQDGIYPSVGIVIDTMTVADTTGVLDYEDFEDEPVGAIRTNDGDWRATIPDSYGHFAALYPGAQLLQEDYCQSNFTPLWAFINGSSATYACGGHAEQTAVPFGKPAVRPRTNYPYMLYLTNEIWSPPIDLDKDRYGGPIPASAVTTLLEFDVYRDLPQDNLVAYVWRVRAIFDGCPQAFWRSDNQYYFSGKKDWFHASFDITTRISAGADQVQIAIGAYDMCVYWCNVYGTGSCHSHAPLIDNVRLSKVAVTGPQWAVNDYDLFQDNFPGDGTKTGTVRMDAAMDFNFDDPYAVIRPADTVTVTVMQPVDGLDYHNTGVPSSGPAVYLFVKDVSVAKSGSAISGDLARFPNVSLPVTEPGWTALRFDSLGPLGGWPPAPPPNDFCVDLDDDLFEPGDTVYYYFGARDAVGRYTYWTQSVGVTDKLGALATAMEVTGLPANAVAGVTDVLYIDQADGHGVEPLFQSAFDILAIRPDRYDVLAPTAEVGNGPGARVTNVAQQLSACYRKIIWSTGDLPLGPGDGVFNPGGNTSKSDDWGMLFDFLDQSPNGPGLYLTGDHLATDWDNSFADAITLRNTYMDFTLLSSNHIALGLPISPFGIGAPASCFDGDTLVVWAGCEIASLDVLQPAGASAVEMSYSGNASHGAVLTQTTPNAAADTARVVLSGFSFHRIHDDVVQVPIDRADHLLAILRWLQNDVDDPTAIPQRPFYTNTLAQNYPNPFNPATTIRYSIKTAGHVSLRVYNVSGTLVRTLVDEVQSPRPGTVDVIWDGRSNAGNEVSSGVYWYRLDAPGFQMTRKMVMLR